MLSPVSYLGPYFDGDGAVTVAGALHFLDPATDVPKTVWADQERTSAAPNPVLLGSDGKLPYQVFYDFGGYKVRHYELVDPSVVSPVFPDDYALVREWVDQGLESATALTGSMVTVDTISDLEDLDPDAVTMVEVLGYYDRNDDIDTRTYYWDPLSVAAPDGGSTIGSNILGTGNWILKRETPVLDVRWWGALPNTSNDCNSAINSCIAFASASVVSTPRAVYFPAGTYRVVPGTILAGTAVRVEMSSGVTFLNRLAGSFVLRISGPFSIDAQVAIQNAASTGTVVLDFTFNSGASARGDYANVKWYQSAAECIQYLGLNTPVLVEAEYMVSALSSDYTICKAKFGPSGKLTHNHTGTVTYQGIEAQPGQEVIAGGSLANPMLAFECDARVSWLDAAALRFASVTDGHVLIVDADDTLAAGAPGWGRWEAAGGVLRLLGTETVNAVVDGPCVRAEGVLTAPYIAEEAYIIADAASHAGFVKSRAESGFTHISYQGKTVGYDLDLSDMNYYFIILQDAVLNCTITVPSSGGILYLDMRNVEFSGSISGDEWYFRLYDSSFAAATMTNGVAGTGIEAFNSTLAIPATGMENMRAKGSTISILGNVGITNRLELRECSVGASTAATEFQVAAITYVDDCVFSRASINALAIPGAWDVRITDSQFNGSFLKFTGTGGSGRIMIRGNEFQNLDLLSLYEPIDDSAMVLSALTGTAFYIGGNSPGMPGQDYTVLANHTPTSGIVVKQTHNKLMSYASAATWSLPIRGGSYWFGKGVPSSPAGFFAPQFARCSSEFNQPTQINYLQGAIDKVSGIQTVNGEPGIWQSVEIDLYQH